MSLHERFHWCSHCHAKYRFYQEFNGKCLECGTSLECIPGSKISIADLVRNEEADPLAFIDVPGDVATATPLKTEREQTIGEIRDLAHHPRRFEGNNIIDLLPHLRVRSCPNLHPFC